MSMEECSTLRDTFTKKSIFEKIRSKLTGITTDGQRVDTRSFVSTSVICLCFIILGISAASTAVTADGSTTTSLNNTSNTTALVDVEVSDLNGSGTATDPYIITNVSELQAMGGEDFTDEYGYATYKLGTDIDASVTAQANDGKGFAPYETFHGTLIGANKTISNLYINRSTERVGLFKQTASASIRNLTLKNITVVGGRYTGGLVGDSTGVASSSVVPYDIVNTTIQNVSITGTVTGTEKVGGVVGWSRANTTIQNVSTTVSVTATATELSDAGGVVGRSVEHTKIQQAITNVSVTGNESIGGLIGVSKENTSIQNASVQGTIDGDSGVGGLVGKSTGDTVIRNISVNGSVDGQTSSGGIVGKSGQNTLVRDTYADVAVNGSTRIGGLVGAAAGNTMIQTSSVNATVTADRFYVGGLGGAVLGNATVRNASAAGMVTGTQIVGGLAGVNTGTVADSFAVGNVTGQANIGGFVGNMVRGEESGTVRDSYWDKESTGQATSSGNATGLTTTQMTGSAALSNMSALEFGTVWNVTADYYPKLIGIPQPLIATDSAQKTGPTVVSSPSTDPDGDGLYEDINGDGKQDVFDVLTYYNLRDSQAIQSNPNRFDFDGDGTPGTLFDALELYNAIS